MDRGHRCRTPLLEASQVEDGSEKMRELIQSEEVQRKIKAIPNLQYNVPQGKLDDQIVDMISTGGISTSYSLSYSTS